MLDDILVISPHLDDAVLSCGDFLSVHPNAVVVTVFAGTPANADLLTDWDAASGFSSAAEAMQMRRKEDVEALRMLDAAPHWLDFLDSQYLATPSIDEVAMSLRTVLDDICPATVLYPAGLFHSDHVLVHDSILTICASYSQIRWLMYEETSYRRIAGLLQRRLRALLEAGWQATPVPVTFRSAQRKRGALRCYASQLRALQAVVDSGYDDAFTAERYWTVEAVRKI